MSYMMASVSGGPVDIDYVVTARELLLFSFFMAITRIGQTRFAPSSHSIFRQPRYLIVLPLHGLSCPPRSYRRSY